MGTYSQKYKFAVTPVPDFSYVRAFLSHVRTLSTNLQAPKVAFSAKIHLHKFTSEHYSNNNAMQWIVV